MRTKRLLDGSVLAARQRATPASLMTLCWPPDNEDSCRCGLAAPCRAPIDWLLLAPGALCALTKRLHLHLRNNDDSCRRRLAATCRVPHTYKAARPRVPIKPVPT